MFFISLSQSSYLWTATLSVEVSKIKAGEEELMVELLVGEIKMGVLGD